MFESSRVSSKIFEILLGLELNWENLLCTDNI